jgi:two-component system phosphate regulon response regulator PhoB
MNDSLSELRPAFEFPTSKDLNYQETSTLPVKASILVVDDEPDILDLIRYNLGREGYRLTCVDSGEKALEEIRTRRPDLMLLDLMLPGVDGLDVCRRIRQFPEGMNLPIIMLTAKSEDADVVSGLECGADDYVTKPFSPRVLLARVKAVLRKRQALMAEDNQGMTFGELFIQPGQHEARVGSMSINLTATEFRILLALARRPGWVFTRQQIVDAARGENSVVTSRSVDVHIVRLRSKLGICGGYVETVRGIGYRFRKEQNSIY